MKKDNPYDQRYGNKELYWGKEPSSLCAKVIEIVRPRADFRPRLIDLGCGEGRNAVYFAQNGFDVVGLDSSSVGLNKMKKNAVEARVKIEPLQADIITYRLTETYDVIFSTGTLHYLPSETRSRHFKDYKDHAATNGICAFSVLVSKPFVPKAPDAEEEAYLYKSGELMSYFWDWEILHSEEEIFNCTSSGIPHKHAVNRIIAKRHQDEH